MSVIYTGLAMRALPTLLMFSLLVTPLESTNQVVREGILSGTVVDAKGGPVPGIGISAVREIFDMYGERRFPRPSGALLRTDDRGEYRISGLEPGDYYVAVLPSEFWPIASDGAVAPTLYPGVPNLSAANAVSVSAGEEVKLGVLTVPGVRTSPVHFNLKNVPDDARTRWVYFRDFWNNLVSVSSVSADTRRNEFQTVLPHGHHDLLIRVTSSAGSSYGVVSVEVVDGTPIEKSVTLSPPAPIRLTIHQEEGDKRRALERVNVSLKGTGPVPSTSRVTDVEGKATIEGIVGTHNRLRITGLPPDSYIASATIAGRDILSEGFQVTTDADIQVVVRIDGGMLQGTVVDGARNPVASATVALIPQGMSDTVNLHRSGISDGSGRFQLKGIAPGEYQLHAWGKVNGGAYLNASFMQAYAGRGQSVRIGAGETITTEVTAAAMQ